MTSFKIIIYLLLILSQIINCGENQPLTDTEAEQITAYAIDEVSIVAAEAINSVKSKTLIKSLLTNNINWSNTNNSVIITGVFIYNSVTKHENYTLICDFSNHITQYGITLNGTVPTSGESDTFNLTTHYDGSFFITFEEIEYDYNWDLIFNINNQSGYFTYSGNYTFNNYNYDYSWSGTITP